MAKAIQSYCRGYSSRLFFWSASGLLLFTHSFAEVFYASALKHFYSFSFTFFLMKAPLPILLLAGASLLGSCASIVSHSSWPVTLSSAPVGATVSVIDRGGKEVFSGVTPAAVQLKSSAGFFQRAKYTINFTKPGYAGKTIPLEADVNGWYFGNLLFGGAIGMLIVDPATGAMYRISQRDVQAALTETTAFDLNPTAPNGLRIVSLDELPTTARALMVRVQP
jgi:hypothetical protein